MFEIGDIIVSKNRVIKYKLMYIGKTCGNYGDNMHMLKNLIIEPGEGTASIYYVNTELLLNVYELSEDSILNKKLKEL